MGAHSLSRPAPAAPSTGPFGTGARATAVVAATVAATGALGAGTAAAHDDHGSSGHDAWSGSTHPSDHGSSADAASSGVLAGHPICDALDDLDLSDRTAEKLAAACGLGDEHGYSSHDEHGSSHDDEGSGDEHSGSDEQTDPNQGGESGAVQQASSEPAPAPAPAEPTAQPISAGSAEASAPPPQGDTQTIPIP